MPFAEEFMINGLFTVPTLPASLNINTGMIPSRVNLTNTTSHGAANLNILNVDWYLNVPTNPSMVQYVGTGGSLVNQQIITANAISAYDGTKSVLLGPAQTGATIAKATSIVTLASHGLQTGDTVLITNNQVMKQIGGLYFTVTVLSANTFGISIVLSGFPADETGCTVRKLIVGPLYYPSELTISAITVANPMTVTTTTSHGLTIGQKVRLLVSSPYGMTQANKIQGVITSVPAGNQFVLGMVDSSAFTAFAYPPTSAAAFAAATFPQVVPIGSGPSQVFTPPFWFQDNLDDAEANTQFQGFTIGTGLLKTATNAVVGFAAGDIIAWTAWRGSDV